MGILSSLFSENKEGKINVLKSKIESCKLSIDSEKNNMARARAAKSPSHYIDGYKRKIEYLKSQISNSKDEIARLKRK